MIRYVPGSLSNQRSVAALLPTHIASDLEIYQAVKMSDNIDVDSYIDICKTEEEDSE